MNVPSTTDEPTLPGLFARSVLTLLSLMVGAAGILMASVMIEYDLKHEDLAAPLQHYLALLAFCLVPVAILLTGAVRTRQSIIGMLAALVLLTAFSLADWPQGVIALPVYLVGAFALIRRLGRLESQGSIEPKCETASSSIGAGEIVKTDRGDISHDTIQLVAFMSAQPGHCSDLLVEYVLEINGQAVYEEFSIDLPELAKSCQLDGEFEIFTCGCGVAGCAGIFQGIKVAHSPAEITWACPEPMAVEDESSEEFESGADNYRHFRFDPVQYFDAIDAGLRAIKGLAVSASGPVEFPVYGITLDDVLGLDAKVFSIHYPHEEKQLIARRVVVYAYHEHISANGIYFRITDLCLPESLRSLHATYVSLRLYPQTVEYIPHFLKYLQAGRDFCRALHEYLGRGATVHFVYKPPEFLIPVAWEVSETIR
jgi:hypothetical protein